MKRFKDFSIKTKLTLVSIIGNIFIGLVILILMDIVITKNLDGAGNFRDTFFKFAILIFVLLTAAVLVIVPIITGFLLKSLNNLKGTIGEIKATKDIIKRAKVESEDEIGILARDFNGLMDRLEKSQKGMTVAQEKLINSEKKSTAAEFALGIVHQINNPLAIAIGRLHLLIEDLESKIGQGDLIKDLRLVQQQVIRATEITNRLLRYVKPLKLKLVKLGINIIIEKTIDTISKNEEFAKINIEKHFDKRIPDFYFDKEQMEGVFVNMIMNAQQALPEGGKIEISTDYKEEEDMVYIKFVDNGCGISPEVKKELFTPFFSTKPDRHGLGLAVSSSIVREHRGSIGVESEVGIGSTFTIKLPLFGMGA